MHIYIYIFPLLFHKALSLPPSILLLGIRMAGAPLEREDKGYAQQSTKPQFLTPQSPLPTQDCLPSKILCE